VKARRQTRTALEWLHLPFEEVRSIHLTRFKKARLKQVKPATVNREMDLLSEVIHKAIDSWDYVIAKNPMKGAKRPIYDNANYRGQCRRDHLYIPRPTYRPRFNSTSPLR
jgi:hypothetical protein